MIGEKKLFPSRSELIRTAAREFLIRELEAAKNIIHTPIVPLPPKVINPEQSEMFIQIPITTELPGEPLYKTYRIIKK